MACYYHKVTRAPYGKAQEAKSAYSKQLNRHNPLPLNIEACWLNNQFPLKILLFQRDDLLPKSIKHHK